MWSVGGYINERTVHGVRAVPLTRCVPCSAASLVCCHERKLTTRIALRSDNALVAAAILASRRALR